MNFCSRLQDWESNLCSVLKRGSFSWVKPCPLTQIGLKKSRLDRKCLCALFSQSLEDLHIISWVRRDTCWSAMWTNSSSGVVLQRSRRWKPKPFVRTWTDEIKHSGSGVGKCKRKKEKRVQPVLNHSQWFKVPQTSSLSNAACAS